MLINTSDSPIISPDAQIVCSSAQMEHGATSKRQQRAKICFALKYLFALAVYVRLNFTPGEENNKSISILVDCFPIADFSICKQRFQNMSLGYK